MFNEKQIVFLEETFPTKQDVIHHLTHLANERILDADRYEQAVLAREESFPTYTIDGVAMPHAKSDAIGEAFVAFARLKTPVRWGFRGGRGCTRCIPHWCAAGRKRRAEQQPAPKDSGGTQQETDSRFVPSKPLGGADSSGSLSAAARD